MNDPLTITLEAQPAVLEIEIGRTGVLVVDMQNDFGAKGGMLVVP